MQVRPGQQAPIGIKGNASLLVYLKAGTTITCISGQLRVTGQPQWLAERVVQTEVDLAEGEVWTLEKSGWITLTACHGNSTATVCDPDTSMLVSGWLRTAARLLPYRAARGAA